jgi:hypothetical protein
MDVEWSKEQMLHLKVVGMFMDCNVKRLQKSN